MEEFGYKEYYTLEEIIEMDIQRSLNEAIRKLGFERVLELVENIPGLKKRLEGRLKRRLK